ncbi:Piso0_003170 [Millerozyma farinosa CBS 7064]|uniref:Piso0_003170 protein n=1 Tax=Pichia sorbitophila (strain ATCC MYA-4447 / BCRC 22081 / CBS 7064 / NBRC 10061 / NRRL Y-12695) TaxID=559304 RepID=G8YKJ2_PICSO|nr:Piso0_003170 [Millerozyma farinosa CBS 7064]CCE80837.1 Piso0_003170 [Millerozyma farinosa CBS 7064]
MEANDDTAKRQASLLEKMEVVNYHKYQTSSNPKHKQSDTIKYFQKMNKFSVSKSSLNRWLQKEKQIRDAATTLTSRNRSQTKIPRDQTAANQNLIEFMEKHKETFTCLRMYFIQNLITSQGHMPTEADVKKMFYEFSTELSRHERRDGSRSTPEIEIEELRWEQHFLKKLRPQLESIADSIEQQNELQKHIKVQSEERERFRTALRDYNPYDIYQFNEILLDIETLFKLIDFGSELPFSEGNYNHSILTGELSTSKMITLTVCCSLDGSNLLKPLIISNMRNNKSLYNDPYTNDYYHYTPDGLNTREILHGYLNEWNTKLIVEDRKVALLLDIYWCHLGLHDKFSNIKFVYTNSKFDSTTSYYHKTHFRLPFAYGFESYLRSHLKMNLFKLLYKNKMNLFMGAIDGLHIINALKTCHDMVTKSEYKRDYQLLVRLGFLASEFMGNKDNIISESSQDGSHGTNNKLLAYHKYIDEVIPEEAKKNIHFSEVRKVYVITKAEKELSDLARLISKSIKKSRINEEIDLRDLQRRLISEITFGFRERKYNHPYSKEGIANYAKLSLEIESQRQSSSGSISLPYASSRSIAKIDSFLINVLQPFLSKHTSLNSPATPVSFSPQTFDLFNQFYMSYVNDSTIIKPSTSKKRKLTTGLPIRNKIKSKEMVSDSDNDEDSNGTSNTFRPRTSSSQFRDTFSDSD